MPDPIIFQDCVCTLLEKFGAEAVKGSTYDWVLKTRLGPLHVKAYDDWVACRFENIEAARSALGQGRLNRHSGKWNWHFEQPGLDELMAFARELADVRFSDDEIGEILPEKGWCGDGRNIELYYIYRDGANYTTDRSIVLDGGLTLADVKLLHACCLHEAHPYFIPGQVALPDLQDAFCGGASEWSDEFDHPYHELHRIKRTGAAPEKNALRARDLVVKFLDVAAGEGWDEEYKPAFYEQRAATQELGATS